MYDGLGRSLGTDYFRIADQLTSEERDYWRRTSDFVDDEVLPVINDYWERAEFNSTIADVVVVCARDTADGQVKARDLLGGNGVLLDFHAVRHMADMEAIHTFEGTETIQTLIVGKDITGVGAFA